MTRDHDAPNDRGEELLTAYALDECTAAERAEVHRLLAGDDAEAVTRQIDDVRRLAHALKRSADELPARSPSLRRAVLASVAAGSTARAGRSRLAWILAGATGLAAALLLGFLPLQLRQRELMRQVTIRPHAAPREPTTSMTAKNEITRIADSRIMADCLEPAACAMKPPGTVVSNNPVALAVPRRELLSIDDEGLRRQLERLPMPPIGDRERYNQFVENRFARPLDEPLSTFSIDVDTASYANVRRFLTAGRRPPRDAVRIEELVNYFRYGYPKPEGDEPFSVTLEAADCPWRSGHHLVRIGIRGRDVARDRRPAGNLVFLVDVSGSMGEPDKLPLVKQALLMLVEELTENDRVAIVTYAGDAGVKLPPTSGDQQERIRAAIESLAAGGSTHGSAGIELAYDQAAERFIPGGANRVILATDGDLNVGITDDTALVDLIAHKAKGGTFLTVLGFGQGNLQDEKMEKLADHGNGVYAYIDGAREARKVLVEQLTGSTLTIAKDVKIQVEFNPAVVESYRLLGYENRRLADEDFRDDTKDAGEIGAGHGVTALYEVAFVGETAEGPGRGAEPLKYGRQQSKPRDARAERIDEAASRELLTVKLRFKQPDGETSRLIEQPLADRGESFDTASVDLRFAAAVAAFGMILRGSEHAGDATLSMVARIAGSALGDDSGGYRAEFLDLVRRAESIQ